MEFHRSLEEAQCVVATSDTSTSDEANYCSRGGHSRQSSSSSFLERQSWADVVDEDDTLDDFDELDAGAAMLGTTVVCDGLSQGSLLHGTGRCKPCAFFYTKGCKSGVGCLFCHVCPPGEKQRRKQIHRRQGAPSGEVWRRGAKSTRNVFKHSSEETQVSQPINTACLGRGLPSPACAKNNICQSTHEAAVYNPPATLSFGATDDVPGWGCQWAIVPGSWTEWNDWHGSHQAHYTTQPQAMCDSIFQMHHYVPGSAKDEFMNRQNF